VREVLYREMYSAFTLAPCAGLASALREVFCRGRGGSEVATFVPQSGQPLQSVMVRPSTPTTTPRAIPL